MSTPWSDEELKASVEVYVEMLDKQRRGEGVIKARYYRALEKRFGRTAKAFEYRAQNISYVYALQGRAWVKGLKPAGNVGVKIVARLEALIAEVEGQQPSSSATFATEVNERRSLYRDNALTPPAGRQSPGKISVSATVYERDPDVVACVLTQADGVCECCDSPAPFTREDGSLFLEVHHLKRLADGGPDIVENAIGLCPNCHRELHAGLGKHELAARLIDKIERLNAY
ncbi:MULTISPECIES: HNH endonuclease [Halomonas]|uniref:HNH endonuclease n=1 Tax=Halomonas halophila TaxID=29573 RepID=A0ABQ0U1J9_9GAMM|nr:MULTISPECIES: HNH endonuclease [Halomonas]MDR5888071.1 HNH endonuclease [Halomonas salina]WJY08595.1 HNH endonuclease [Halomonas halophila]GEK72227.1 HNH endonuclease [Halomonas halophila]